MKVVTGEDEDAMVKGKNEEKCQKPHGLLSVQQLGGRIRDKTMTRKVRSLTEKILTVPALL